MGTSVQTNNSPAGVESGSALSLFPGYLSPSVRRRNTTYKNPQLVAQHCFVASFYRCFPFFTLLDQLDPQQKHLLRVEEMRRADWLICRARAKSCEFDEGRATKPKFVAQSRPPLYFSQQLSSTRNKCFCFATS